MSEFFAIDIKGLKKSYGSVQALRGVNLSVKRGEILGFLGPNGAGKTTTIRCLLDLIRPQAGTIRVLGLDPAKDPVAVRSRIGYLPGELNLESNQTVKAALQYFADLRGRKIDWQYVHQLIERLELNPELQIKNLSKGNKQKVGIVQALMSKPDLLLLDEPTSGLDPLMQQEVYRLLREAKADGTTIFFSSHIISEVEAIAERVVIIREGVIVEEAEPQQLINMALRRYRVRFREPIEPLAITELAGVTIIDQQSNNELILQVEGEVDHLIKVLSSYPVSDLQSESLSLEEVFLAHYQKEQGGEQ
ncbi:MAG: ABC transporter ATP-binding protein [Firmicutes bacterium]|nr:ABC transporter ATP-binding protein [Bacillota bacterium]